jgi:hypothetical protein
MTNFIPVFQASLIFVGKAKSPWWRWLTVGRLLPYSQILDKPEKSFSGILDFFHTVSNKEKSFVKLTTGACTIKLFTAVI